jgi:ATP-dependent Clp protease adaptor protein ClpS
MDDADRGRRGLRARPSPDLFRALREHWGLRVVHGGSDLGGSSSLNLLVGDGGRLLEVEAWVDHDAVMDSWERLAAAMGLLARTHDLLRAVEAGEAGRRPRFANHLEPADVLAQARRGTARIRGWGPAAEEAGLADAADQLAERVAEAEAGLVPQLPRQLVHGDFWDDNVLFRNGRPVLLADFDFMAGGGGGAADAGRPRPLAGRVRPARLVAVPVDRGGGAPLPVLAQQGVADAVVDGAVLVGPGPPVVGLLDVAAAAQDGPHGQVVAPGLGLDAPDPWPAPEDLAGQPADGGGADPGAPVALGDAQVPARVPPGVQVLDPQEADHLAVQLQPPGARVAAVQVPGRHHLGRLGRADALPHVERPAVLAQEPGQLAPVGAGQRPVGRLGHGRMVAGCATMSRMSTTAPTRERTERPDDVAEPDIPWVVIVWNDPVNLMSYVVFVLQKLFGYDREKATRLMLDVHHKGKAVVSSGPREKAEFDVYRLHGHGLWATMQKDR